MRHVVPAVPRSRADLAALIDHTAVAAEATARDVEAAVRAAADWGCAAVTVNPSQLAATSAAGAGQLGVCAVVGFPSGAHNPEVKSAEAAYAMLGGATEIEMVVDLGLAKAGAWTDLEDEIAAVRGGCSGTLLKVVVESAVLDDDELARAAEAAGRAGADYVVSSTGFHPAGGATQEAVRILRSVVGEELGVKASGGITTAAQAFAMVGAGASRIGCAATADLLAGFEA